MKQKDVFGVRRATLLYSLAILLALVGMGLFVWAYLAFDQDWLFWCIFLMLVIAIYMVYLTLYEAVFRYEKPLQIKGHFVVAKVSFEDQFGRPRDKIAAVYFTENGKSVGDLLGNFAIYRQKPSDGDKVYCYMLDDGRFLAVDPKSKLYKDPNAD